MKHSFEYTTSLEYRLKAATAELNAFRSGDKYVQMEKQRLQEVRSLERMVSRLKKELAGSRRGTVTVRNQWFEIFEQLQKEYDRMVKAARQETARMEQRAIKAEQQLDKALSKVADQRRRIYETETQLEDEKGKNLKLRAQLNRDYENSSIPSSKGTGHKKISNSREKTGRRPGAQPGHKGHCRKKQAPTAEPVLLPPPQEVLEDPDFKKTSKTIVKQLVNIRVVLEVTEYYKRKQQQAVSFRSQDSIDYLCQCMSVLVRMRQTEEVNIFRRVSEIFG
jgi:hypothetical protein